MNLIEVKNVYKQYKNGVTALSDITISIPKGDFVFVIGSTASGKSTLIKLLYRQEKPSRGEVYVGGINVSKLRNRKVYKLRRKLGIVFQDYKLLQNLTVFENVAFALEIYGLPENEVRKKVMNAIEKVGLKEKFRSYPDQLSGGEQQRVAIARAISKNPKILLCDEPTGALDYKTGKQILKLLQDTCRKENMTVVIITHNSAISPMADKIIKFRNGATTDVIINKKPKDIEEIEW